MGNHPKNFNTSFHTAIKLILYKIDYGKSSSSLPMYGRGDTKVISIGQALKD